MDPKPEINAFTEIKGLKDVKLISYSLFIIWPLLVIVSLGALVYYLFLAAIKRKSLHNSPIKFHIGILFQPFHLIRSSAMQKEIKTVLAILLLLPFMIGTIISPVILLTNPVDKEINLTYEEPQPPALFHLFQDSGSGLFGINGQGESIAQLIFRGTGQIYILTLFTVLFVVITGLWLGKQTYHRRTESFIMGLSETLESIPIFFILLVVLSIFGWVETTMKEAVPLLRFSYNILIMLLIAVLMGLSFLPRLIRIIQERIKTFSSENFIDSNKALGISQNKILWYHIIRKNCLEDIILFISQIWASIILLELSMDYLVSIFPVLGARIYSGWAQMLLSSETVRAILFLKELNFQNWWLYFFPIFFIITTVSGFFIYGESIKKINDEKEIEPGEMQKLPFRNLIQKLIAR
jgi:ABC-type dipeptide/oligopeptide/nickel transport system permease subunit